MRGVRTGRLVPGRPKSEGIYHLLNLLSSLLRLTLLVLPNFVRETGCEGDDEGRRGSVWDRVILYRDVSVGGSPIEPHTVHDFQYIRVLVEYLHSQFRSNGLNVYRILQIFFCNLASLGDSQGST